MRVSFKLFLVVALTAIFCSGVQAQTFPPVHVAFPGDTSGAAVDLDLTVIFNPAGFVVPLPGGGTALLHYRYEYAIRMNDDIPLPITMLTDFDVSNCLSSLFVALLPTVLADPLIGASHPELFTPPIWSSGVSLIHWSNPLGGPAFMARWQFTFYSDVAPSAGTVTLGAVRVNVDCSIEHPTLTIPYFGPCPGPGTPPPCKSPICNAGGPYSGPAGTPIAFDGTGSSGNGSPITSYSWNFGDGAFGAGATPTHTYAAAGLYTVVLTVTNECGKSCSCSTTVRVRTPPQETCPTPICDAGGPYSGTAGVPITFNGSGSSGPPPKTIVSYHWDFGDSTGFDGVTPTHTYAAAGTYIVVLTVTNSCGNSCSCSTRVRIAAPPSAPPPCLHNFKVAQVYPAMPCDPPAPFKPLGTWDGDTVTPFSKVSIPGVLCLSALPNNRLNVNAFITCCPGGTVSISDVRLVKTVPGSAKYPGAYPAYTAAQIGVDQIRTWWCLDYTMPGTTFALTLTGTCSTPGTPGGGSSTCPRHKPGGSWRSPCNCGGSGNPGTPGSSQPYSDVWVWEVVANPDTFILLLDLFHSNAIGLSEVSCIPDESVFDGLVQGAQVVKTTFAAYKASPTAARKVAAIDAVQNLEVFVLANCLMVDWLPDIAGLISLPPGNFLPAGAGIWNTLENPCCSKLLVDLEYLQKLLDKATPL